MNVAMSLSVFDDESQSKIAKRILLYPEWTDYEERKRELKQMNLSNADYEIAVRLVAEELDL